jgi:DNA-directed RNA polymerase subunit RPC12/RpoP
MKGSRMMYKHSDPATDWDLWCKDHPEPRELPEEYQYWECPECGERLMLCDKDHCGHLQDDCDIEGDVEAWRMCYEDAKAEAKADL